LSHVHFNKHKNRYELDQLHLTLVNSAFAMKDLLKKYGTRTFRGKEIIENDLDKLNFEPQVIKTIELSTRFHYDETTGFYLS